MVVKAARALDMVANGDKEECVHATIVETFVVLTMGTFRWEKRTLREGVYMYPKEETMVLVHRVSILLPLCRRKSNEGGGEGSLSKDMFYIKPLLILHQLV